MSAANNSLPLPATRRILSDLKELTKSLDGTGIYFHHEDDNLRKVWVVITGSDGTPYEDCPMWFEFEFPDMYPMISPKGKFCTGDGKTRFNPNLYVDGKICLSILGTWQGPSWTPVMTLHTIINSICALVMNEEPLRNEPGWERSHEKDIKEYNQVVEYRCLCVGLVQQLKNTHQNFMPMREKMLEHFKRNFGRIMERVRQRKEKLDGKTVTPRFGASWKLDYSKLEQDLLELGKDNGLEVEVPQELPDVSRLTITERPKPKDCEVGQEWEQGGKRYVCAVNARGVKFWKKN